MTDTDSNLVPVFYTVERGLLPLATMALEEAGIPHVVRHPHISGIIVGERSDLASAGPADQAPMEILVASEDESRAHRVLDDLARSGPGASMPAAGTSAEPGVAPAGVSASTSVGEAGAVVLDAQTGAKIAQLTDDQLAWLGRHLELESSGDTDYYLDRPTIEMLERAGADTALVATLRSALGAREGIDVRWSRGSK
jgi:processive 1,2-diacylglycerol beta-glucosyltransferase